MRFKIRELKGSKLKIF